ncbi:MAG: hypothetical protein JNM81_13695, partial [Rhodospirillaceae bacterium]|nr:hypothetical protein [Rhodospirillaceae bacterium]
GVNKVKGWFHGNRDDDLDMTGVGPVITTRRPESLLPKENDHNTSSNEIGGLMFAGDQFDRSASVRDRYNDRVSGLSDTLEDKRIRENIRFDERANTPVLVRGILDRYKPLSHRTDEQLAKLHSPNKTSTSVNYTGKIAKMLGPAGVTASAVLGAEQIANSDDKVREAFGVGGSMLGGTVGGIGGATAGTFIAPGAGTIIGGVGGSMAGSAYGEQRGYDLYDGIGRKFARRGP